MEFHITLKRSELCFDFFYNAQGWLWYWWDFLWESNMRHLIDRLPIFDYFIIFKLLQGNFLRKCFILWKESVVCYLVARVHYVSSVHLQVARVLSQSGQTNEALEVEVDIGICTFRIVIGLVATGDSHTYEKQKLISH